MKWTKKENLILDDETGELICALPQREDELRDKIIELAPEMFSAILLFIEGVDNGSLKAKSTYDMMAKIIEKIPKYVLNDERVTAA